MAHNHHPEGPSIAAAIGRLRKSLNVSQSELGSRMGGVTQQMVSKLETGKIPMTRAWVARVAKGLQVPSKAIYEESRKKP